MLTTGINRSYINGAVAQGPEGSKAAEQPKQSQGILSWLWNSEPTHNQLRVDLRDSKELRALHAA